MATLHQEAFLNLRDFLGKPVEVEHKMAHKTIKQLVSMDTELETPAGSVVLRRVEYRILPEASTENLIGRSELERLNLPSLEDSLEAVMAEA